MTVRLPLAALALAGLVLLCSPASAQLKLPKRKAHAADSSGPKLPSTNSDKVASKGIVPHLVCATCGLHNYTSRMDRPQPDGSYTAHCNECGSDVPHRRAKEVAADQRVQLPSGAPTHLPPGSTSGGARPVGATLIGNGARYGDGAAGFILRQIANSGESSESLIEKAIESLLGLGPEGLLTCRIALHDSFQAVVLTAGRVLVRAAEEQDAERVVARLQTRMPGKSGPRLLEELVVRNPVYGSPALLVDLLAHPQQPMRVQAARLLAPRLSPEVLPLLKAQLGSKRSDTRLAALDLISKIEDPAVVEILFEQLDDHSSQVSRLAIEALAVHPSEQVDLELLSRALSSQWILREQAFALLAIIEREDDQLRPILDDRHAQALLRGLRSRDALVHGTCAAALAGIGYRSSQPLDTSWLDLEVTGTMIGAISGKEFHSDFTVMQPRVLRRLRLLTGEDFGTDGPAWAEWWVSQRSNFYAHRAFLKLPRDGENALEVHFRGSTRDGGAFSLFGSEAWTRESERRAGAAEKLLMTRRECLDLLALMEREGVLGPQVAPGMRGTAGRGQRQLEIVIDGHGKIFTFGSGRSAAWFEKLASATADLRERNLWQRFRPIEDFNTPLEFWEAEAGWWGSEHTEAERGLRLKDLIFGSMKRMPPSKRSLALHELENLYRQAGVPRAQDFDLLLDLLRDEGFFAQRTQQLIALAMQSASIGADGSMGPLDEALGVQLMDLLLARFAATAVTPMGEIAMAIGPEYVQALTSSERPLLRVVAAAELAREPSAEDRERLIAMLDDPEPMVEAAAATALGKAHVEEARTELLLRARLASPMVRAAALRAIGQLGGEYVLEALVLGVSDPDPEIKRGAAEGLAVLGDPQSAPLLISLLRRGRESATFETAWYGLIRLGDEARPHLRRVVNSPAHAARRECALLLARLQDPSAVPALISLLHRNPQDSEAAFELAVMSCVDQRGEENPASAWQTWYSGVTHGDALNWLLAAIERGGTSIPVGANFHSAGAGTLEASLILLELLGGDQDFLAERARREFGRLMGGDLGQAPKIAEDRQVWLRALRETILERFDS